MDNIAQRLKAYIEAHPFDPGDSDCETVLDQLYQVYQESHESDPPDIRDGFRELDDLLRHLPCHWKTIIPSSTSAAAFVPTMSIKHSWTVSNTVRT